jgi:hypothetical protein
MEGYSAERIQRQLEKWAVHAKTDEVLGEWYRGMLATLFQEPSSQAHAIVRDISSSKYSKPYAHLTGIKNSLHNLEEATTNAISKIHLGNMQCGLYPVASEFANNLNTLAEFMPLGPFITECQKIPTTQLPELEFLADSIIYAASELFEEGFEPERVRLDIGMYGLGAFYHKLLRQAGISLSQPKMMPIEASSRIQDGVIEPILKCAYRTAHQMTPRTITIQGSIPVEFPLELNATGKYTLLISVADWRMPEDELPKMDEPQRLAKATGGELLVNPGNNATTFTLTLPYHGRGYVAVHDKIC